ncbi:hypothetical protein OROGR_007020 [Orobanche gracilis]
MKLRKSVLFLLLVTVFAPIVLYTDTLGVYFTSNSSRNQFMEDVSTVTFSGEVRPLNALPQKIQSIRSPIYASSGENTRITRQLTEELTEDTTNSSTLGDKKSLDENPIRQVIDEVHKAEFETGQAIPSKPKLTQNIEIAGGQNDVKGEIRYQHSKGTSENTPEKKELTRLKQSPQTSVKDIFKARAKKQNERTAVPDARVHHLKDQLIQAKVYLSLSATRNHAHFMRELRLRMKEVQRVLGEATKDSELPRNAYDKLKAMEQTLSRGKQIQDDCAAVVKKLRAMLHLAEDQLRVHRKQTSFLTHLTAKTMPKGLHCLPLRLSTEYFMLNSSQRNFPNKEQLDDPKLYHYALFSDNILAAAVVVNSTITHAEVKKEDVVVIQIMLRDNYQKMGE